MYILISQLLQIPSQEGSDRQVWRITSFSLVVLNPTAMELSS
jgi:hypothetical protein